jgi:hypothetical protein
MYDNSSTLALTATGVTVVGQSAGIVALGIAGIVVLLGVIALKASHRRRTDGPS